MPYTINNTRNQVVTTVADNVVDTTTLDVTLIGKNYVGYGEAFNENVVKMLENFASTSAPANPIEGQCWWDITSKTLKTYTDGSWKAVGAPTTSATAPTGAQVKNGDLWYDTTNKQLKIYDLPTTSWRLIGPDYPDNLGLSGQQISTIVDSGAVTHTVVDFYIGNQRIGILSKDAQFTPQTPISGFAVINPGLNFSTAVTGIVFSGTADNSLALNGLTSSQFMRSDQNTSTTGTLSVTNNNGVSIGSAGNLALTVSGSDTFVRNIVSNGNLTLAANVAGTPTSLITVNGTSSNVRVLSTAATTSTTTGALTVAGGVGVAGNLHVGGAGTFTGNVSAGNLIGTIATASQTNITAIGNLSTGNIATLTVSTLANVTASTASTSTTTGALQVAGGVGVVGNINAGNVSATNLTGTIATASQPNITSVGTLASLAVTGNITSGNTSGTTATFTNLAGTLTTASQPNITAIGNLSTGNIATLTVSTFANVTATTAATSTITGALRIAGGVGIQGNLHVTNATIGNLTVNGTISGTIAGAAEAVTLAATNTTNGVYYLNFTQNATGNESIRTDTDLTYNPSTNIITSTIARVALLSTNTTNATHYITFVDSTSGNEEIRTDTGIRYNPSTNALSVDGDVTAFASSDRSLKENIENITEALDKISKINGVRFDWNSDAREMYPERINKDVGVIAQEIQQVLPEIVTMREDGYLAVRYEKIVPLLIEAIKELNSKVEALSSQSVQIKA